MLPRTSTPAKPKSIRRKQSLEENALHSRSRSRSRSHSRSHHHHDMHQDPDMPPVPAIPQQYRQGLSSSSVVDTISDDRSSISGGRDMTGWISTLESSCSLEAASISIQSSSFKSNSYARSQSSSHSKSTSASLSKPRSSKRTLKSKSSVYFENVRSRNVANTPVPELPELPAKKNSVSTDGLIAIAPPREIPIYIETLSKACTSTARGYLQANVISSNSPASSIYPKVMFETDHLSRWIDSKDDTCRPDGLVFPETMISLAKRDKYAGWLDRMLEYGEQAGGDPSDVKISSHAHLPDLFSAAHRVATRSNGRTIIVTLYRSPSATSDRFSSSPRTHVYVTPCVAADLHLLGSAATTFKNKLGFLDGPVTSLLKGPGREDCEKEWYEVVETEEGSTGREADFPVSITIPHSERDSNIPTSGDRRTIQPEHLQYLISETTRELYPNVLLEPDAHERFTRYEAIFHTFKRSCVELYDGEDDQDSFRDDMESLMKQMSFVSGATGGIASTFAFHLTPNADAVSTTILPSWHFWEQQRKDLIDIANDIYQAILPSFIVPSIVKATLMEAGFGLPVSRLAEKARVPVENEFPQIKYNRCRLTSCPAELVWCNFPEKQIRDADAMALRGKLRQAQLRKKNQTQNSAIMDRGGVPVYSAPPEPLYPAEMMTPASPTRGGLHTPLQLLLGTPQARSIYFTARGVGATK